jgi:serine/threonine protein kinase/tetratricopeptide (TPR) repeat protein
MPSERWQRFKELFHSAVAVEAGQRAAFLDKACDGDPSLREEVEALLASDEKAKDFIETPAVEMAAKSFASDVTDAMEGRRIGPYKILREIGHGGMGVVYLAERADQQYEKRVAIKVIRRRLDADSRFRRFRSEQQILANLDHPNIAKLLDGGTTEDHLSYFIMDYIEGLPMDLYCDKHKLPTVERLELFRAACASVQYAHQHDILHCDLKPSNFLITAEGVPKLLDFGIAKLLNPQPSSQKNQSTVTGLRPMTLEYASPEQVRGETITPASDVYSLGLVLYELLTGHCPYGATSSAPQEMERMICEHQPEKPSAVISRTETIPGLDGTAQVTVTPESVSAVRDGQPEKLRRRLVGDLDNIVLMALRKEPERRYGSVEQFSEDIRRHLNGEPVLARRDTLWYRSAKFLKRNRAAVVASALTAVILALVAIGLGLLTGRTQVDSIAVLPFASVSSNPNTGYLSEGITETVMNELTRLPNLKVVSSASAVGYGRNEQDPQAVGRSLKVQGVLTGKVAQSGNDLTVHAELVDVRTNRHLWEREYTRKLSEIVVLEKEIARQISANFTERTGEGEERAEGSTENPDAYREYLVGRHFWSQRNPAALEQGLQHFQRAIELDSNYGLAWSGLADSYVAFASFRARSAKESYIKARAAAIKALELEPTLAEGHSALAMVNLYYDWDWVAAEREFNRAIALKPGDTTARMRYGLALAWFQRFDDARREIERGLEVNPVDPLLNSGMGQILYFARQYDQALVEYRKALVLDPNLFFTYQYLGGLYTKMGSYDKAIAALKKATELGGGAVKGTLAHAYAVSGQTSEARKIIADLTDRSSQTYSPPFDVAVAYAGLGDYDQAFAWLEKAYDERARNMLSLKVTPLLDPLRSDPRFIALVRRMKVFGGN